MSQPQKQEEKSVEESKGNEDIQFFWGIVKGVHTFYESFTLDGIKYTLYDCVYMHRDGQAEPDIGKLVNIWETENSEKKVEVVWFFRPTEIASWLGEVKPLQRELFLASGHGKGLSNLSPLEAICGKCNILCTSKHKRNPQPTDQELRMADYIFYRTFDVGKCVISEKFPSLISGIKVDRFFNMKKDTKPSLFADPKACLTVKGEVSVRAVKINQSARLEKVAYRNSAPDIAASGHIINSTKKWPYATTTVKNSETVLPASTYGGPLKKRKLPAPLAEGPRYAAHAFPPSRDVGHEKHLSANDSGMRKNVFTGVISDDKERKSAEKGVGNIQHINPAINYKYIEVARKPGMDSSKWLKLEVWNEERLCEMNEKGTLILLENLDPTFTSAEVEDIIWYAFEKKIKAKMVQPTTFSNPHYGQAFVILKTKEEADDVLSRLANGSLMLGDGRPIVGRRRLLSKAGLSGEFYGHLTVDRARHRRQREAIRNAVATSHFSQSNTIEHLLALQWCLLHEKSKLWWGALHEEQGKEIEASLRQMKVCDMNIQGLTRD
ncbi:nucleic acid binding [Striga hermonthica]|uniref:Nucleic acid binding n=1 Tax=Striga hermonthica TaxID=68872 RepID=A0A9N7R0P7_STRHE|nr:nucleic acid binding [Striga hermonthica]